LARDVEVASEAILGWDGGEKIVDGFRADLALHGVAVGVGLRKIAHGYLGFPGQS
jgi:hypothetical protein